MTLEACRKWLLGIWGFGFIVPFTLIVVQSAAGKYGMKFDHVLGWLTSLTLPTILLMIGVMVANPAGAKSQDKQNEVDRAVAGGDTEAHKDEASKTGQEAFVFNLTAGVSIFYLLIVSLVFLGEPYLPFKLTDLMGRTKIFLAVFDAFISLLIGYFFGKK
jgi:hypothetical protein